MAVSDVNMSSEGSGSSSRLRQFGLYKTIDSRTAEFLKLSRKRQIRRGCACAAVSTAITVTVVVSALLVYEYGFHTESKMAPSTLRKFNWFNAVNDTEINFDNKRDTLAKNKNNKLLPIILKALDQKRYLETIIEEHTTSSYDRTTDYNLEKNVFTDPRNWKMSPIKMNEVGYKGPPQGFFKSKHKDSFAKVRKIIDYQRILTYLNSMPSNNKVDETTRNDMSSTWKPDSTTHHDILNQYNYQRPDVETNKNEDTDQDMDPVQKYKTSKEINKQYCKCPNHSNLADILKKLYKTIQQLHPRIIEIRPNNTKACEHKAVNLSAVKDYGPIYQTSDQETPSPVTVKNKKISFYRISNKPIKFKSERLTTQSPELSIDKTTLTNKQSDIPNAQNEYKIMPYKDTENGYYYTADATPWKLDFGIRNDDVTSVPYIQMDKTTTTTNPTTTNQTTISPTTTNTNKNNLENKTKLKDTSSNGSNLDDDDDIDPSFAYEMNNNILPESKQYLQSLPPHIDKEKSKVFGEYNYLANYMDGLSKLYTKTLIVNKPPIVPPTATPTIRTIDLKKFFSHEKIDPLIKLTQSEPTTIRTPPIINLIPSFDSEYRGTNRSGLPPPDPEQVAARNKKIHYLKMTKSDKLLPNRPRIDIRSNDNKPLNEPALLPMIESYLLSKNENEILNFKSGITANTNESSIGSDELPFDLKFFSNEDTERIYNNFLRSAQTTTSRNTRNLGGNNKKYHSKTPNNAKKSKKKNESTSIPMFMRELKPLENYPEKPEHKSYKTKKVLYMTGSEMPPDDFEANLHKLMYFDKSPVNYTALTDSFLNRSNGDSKETAKSMIPEIRPSYLEVRRNHDEDDFDTHMYAYDERTRLY